MLIFLKGMKQMDESIIEKLQRLVDEGKITPKEKEELLDAMSVKREMAQVSLGMPKKIEIQSFKNSDFEIIGDDSINGVVVDEGADLLKSEMVGETLKISHKLLGEKFFGFNTIRVRLPSSIQDIEIKLVSGDLSIQNVHSKILTSVVSGDTKVSGVSGALNVNAMSGDISIDDFTGEVELVTKSGDIEVKDSKINGIFKTYSGDVSLNKVELGEFKISTYSGDLNLAMAVFKGNGEVVTYFGDISIEGDLEEVFLKTETLSGEIYGTNLENMSLNKEKKIYEIIAKTKSGDISVKNLGKGG
jgi:hypothetical protein